MEKLKILLRVLFWGVLACSMNAFAVQGGNYQEGVGTPAAVEDLVYVRPFALSRGYRWSPVYDEPETDIGFIIVLRVNPQLVIPRDEPGPILYVGDRMLQTLNFGHTSGHVIGLIPGRVDLSATPIWFGAPASSGRGVTPRSIRSERAQATKAGIRPFSAKQIESVTKPAIVVTNLQTLLRGELADLVLEYAPEEGHLARKWRLPEAKAGPDPSPPEAVTPQRQKLEQ